MVSFLHTADLHLGLRVTRFGQEVTGRIREARFQALERIRQKAADHDVAFVLIAGDLFDDDAVEMNLARRAFDLLDSFRMPVFVLPGNHDPLTAGSIWERYQTRLANGRKVRLLSEDAPVEVDSHVLLFPCPVRRKTSMQDPTTWIRDHPHDRDRLRIGVAHGSLKIRDDLPADDHLIARDAATELGLDYLALGHWHSRQLFKGSDGVERTAYPGVHESFRFQGSTESRTGWQSYTAGNRQEFLDSGQGEVLLVRLDRPGAAPEITKIETGCLTWLEESYQLATDEDLGRLIDRIGTRARVEQTLLRLKLEGVLNADAMLRLGQLEEVLARYVYGSLDTSGLHIEPAPEELASVVGSGVVRKVFEKLQADTQAPDLHARKVAERALVLLYQVAKEAQG